MKEITVPATLENVRTVTEFVNEQLNDLNCSMSIRMQIDIVIDELFSNIANYAYSPEEGTATVRVDVTEEPLSSVITFIDHGKPYNPLTAATPDTVSDAKQRPIGGLGVFMVKRIMDDLAYEYRDGMNILTVRKKICAAMAI